ncbi:hypothetical protein BST81_23895 [Leptolyngbya sp. 'hensonii']|uniref:glucosaminidase domain-containing protein n=1 Tax=Leptolyngbya sp. 'hensonii' TaxID=1922337 RepID=UPI00094F580D|nr:glucosaminidase domain-containing protein [Leptolyngbya sp. 'hensonii']OLP15871.1 hypothetical protein BST81_23895 [Leptolyngbya sp. 'hensonii']
MGRIFISAGYCTGELASATIRGTSPAQEIIHTRDLVIRELKLRGLIEIQDYFIVPDVLDVRSTIDWINYRALPGDVALEIQDGSKGAEVFHPHLNLERQKDAQTFLETYLNRVGPLGIADQGVKPDVPPYTPLNGLSFCRQVRIPSLLLKIGFIDNGIDIHTLNSSRVIFAEGIADALIAFELDVRSRNGGPLSAKNPTTDIELNGRIYEDRGILVNSNSYVPIDLADNLGIDLSESPAIVRVGYGGVVYIKAIDLQSYGISVRWNSNTKTTILSSHQRLSLPTQIMGQGRASAFELTSFLKDANGGDYITKFLGIAEMYIEEAALEGVNHDIAFCQMCLETRYLKFGGDVRPNQNNFCSLGTIGSGVQFASFFDMGTGIKAHIQHLKAYASTEPVNKPPIVDPRFSLVKRGVASDLESLAGRWSVDPHYGKSIRDTLQRLYATTRL